MAKGEHLARMDNERLLITFEICKVVALVGTANIFKNARRCSGREGTGGGGSSVPGGAARRIREIKNFSFRAKQTYLEKEEKGITNIITPSEWENISIKRHTGPVPREQVQSFYLRILIRKASEPYEVFSWGKVVMGEFRGPGRPNPSKTI